jgi:hypothetical protein
LRTAFWLVPGVLLLCLPAIYNGFPLVYSDTGAYLATAFEGKVPMARPSGYGMFIRFTAIGGNLWLPLVAQALLFAGLMFRTVAVVLPGTNRHLAYAISLAVVTGLTGTGWYASQLMPDVFTGLVVLGFYLLLFDREMNWLGRWMVAIALYGFCFSHYSHVALLGGLVGGMGAIVLVQRLRRRAAPFPPGRLVWAAVPVVMAVLNFYWVNYSHGFGVRMTRSAHVFTMARLSETGLLADYLHETCAEQHWSLCPYMDALPSSAADFIWSDASPFKKTGYWEGARPGYDSLLADFFGRRAYLLRYLGVSAEAGLAQLLALSVGEGITPYNESSAPYQFLERRMLGKLPSYTSAIQFNRTFDFRIDKGILQVTMALSFIGLLGIGFVHRKTLAPEPMWFTVLAVSGYVANAFVTGAFANVYSRLQARIAWLIPLAFLVLLLRFLGQRRTDPGQRAKEASRNEQRQG